MDLPVKPIVIMKFFGQKIYLEPTDNPQINRDLRRLFLDSHLYRPPLASRSDVQGVLNWMKNKIG